MSPTETKPQFHPEQLPEAMKEIEKILDPLDDYAHQCHSASCAIVNANILDEARVARGVCMGVGSQHSWVIWDMDCWNTTATIIDPTLWSYDDGVEGIWTGSMHDGRHKPHGMGSIWKWGKPEPPTGEILPLDKPEGGFSEEAKLFLQLLGPLDETGWRTLASRAPVEEWPAREILEAVMDTFAWGEAVIPIDIVGMLTERNPGGLYLPGGERE